MKCGDTVTRTDKPCFTCHCCEKFNTGYLESLIDGKALVRWGDKYAHVDACPLECVKHEVDHI